MQVLIAEDHKISRKLLEIALQKRGFGVVVTQNGREALDILCKKDAPQLAILDWMMPELDGISVIEKVRQIKNSRYIYIILLTAKCQQEEIVTGLDAGANDYLIKPFNAKELHARVRVGLRMIELQNSLTEHVIKLEKALSQIKRLQGLLPICSYCKSIRNDENYWQEVETYMSQNSEARFSHSICPDCYKKYVQPQLDAMK
jgi:phosphoserine phosphatase RsbU/P